MELLENNIVQKKLNSLDTLPDGYTPNLESKWSMLEAGLEGNKKTASPWKPIYAAALILFLGGAALLLQQIKQRHVITADHVHVQPAIPSHKISPKVTTPILHPITTVVKDTETKPAVKQSKLVVTIPETPTTIWKVSEEIVEQPQEIQTYAATLPKIKKQQFIEIDFSDVPIVHQQNTEPSFAFRPFKFGLGQQNNTNSISTESPHENAFRFQRSF
ncbi:MAG: hypothetical protein V4651_10725 [Bacteroidota bacterium]